VILELPKAKNMEYWFAFTVVCTIVAYYVGRREGIRHANRSAIQRGAWVGIVHDVKCIGGSWVPGGVQGIITGVDRWDRLSLWIAEPWVKLWGKSPQVYGIHNLTRLRARPLHSVEAEMRDATLCVSAKWESEMKDSIDMLLPPVFLETRRFFDRP